MRAICFICFLLTVASAIVASADDAAVRPAQACQGKTCPHSAATAKSTIDLDVRVLEINVTKLKALGFDLAAIHGSVGSGLIGFLDALDREGLVAQDFTLSQRVVDGESWETGLRWRVAEAKGSQSVWRNLRLRVCPTSLDSDRIRLDTACGAHFSKEPPTVLHTADPSMVEFAADISHQTLCLNANFVAADPGQFPKHEIRVFVLIRPHASSVLEEKSDGESRPDLLAPRNVLDRQAAAVER